MPVATVAHIVPQNADCFRRLCWLGRGGALCARRRRTSPSSRRACSAMSTRTAASSCRTRRRSRRRSACARCWPSRRPTASNRSVLLPHPGAVAEAGAPGRAASRLGGGQPVADGGGSLPAQCASGDGAAARAAGCGGAGQPVWHGDPALTPGAAVAVWRCSPCRCRAAWEAQGAFAASAQGPSPWGVPGGGGAACIDGCGGAGRLARFRV